MIAGLRAVMKRLRTQFDLEDFTAAGMADESRWNQAKSAVDGAIQQLQQSGGLDPSVDVGALGDAAMGEAIGLGPLESLLQDSSVREIVVEGPGSVVVDYGQGLKSTSYAYSSAEALMTVAKRLSAQAGHPLPKDRPVHEVTLPYGPHITIIQPPIAVRGPILEIRRIGANTSLDELVSANAMSQEIADVLKRAVDVGKNIVVMGPVGSGVTTML